ncbi:MAG: hypothetical protein V1802_00910, partial [Candidatus Aenigmatarchaeota archaeon]
MQTRTCRKIFVILLFLIPLLLYSGNVYADLQCAVKDSCNSGEVAILNLENDQGGHAELSSQTNYQYRLCCLDTSGSLGNSCSGNFIEVLKLSSPTNAHVEVPLGTYPYSACLSAPSGVTIGCNYKTACDSGYIPLASISGSTNAHIGDSLVFDTKICCKTSGWMQPPSVIISHSPKFIGSMYNVVLDAQAIDEKNVAELKIYVNGLLTKTCTGPSPTLLCSHTILGNTYQHGAVVSYYAIATDSDGNSARSPVSGDHNFTVCSLDSAILSSDCIGTCDAGEKINITATYHGACPGTTQDVSYTGYVQTDSASSDAQCRIERIRPFDPNIQGFISGMDMTCSSPLNGTDQIICKKPWVIPSIPLACQGETMAATYASINNQSLPPSGQLFDAIPAGGSFQFSASPMNFFVNVSISNIYPNYGDLINATIRCYVTQGSDSVNCTEQNSQIDNIKFNDVTMTDLQSHRRFNGISWIVEINTTNYNNGPASPVRANVTVTYKPTSKTKYNDSSTYVVNFPPQISDISHTPPQPYPNEPVTFNATIIDPEGDSIDAAVYSISETKMCDMSAMGSDKFSCTHDLRAGENEYYIIAVDGHGARNSSEPRYLTLRGERINISINYPDVESGLVKLVDGNPNYTRSMPIKLSITLQIVNTTTGVTMFFCTGDSSIPERKCTVNAKGVNIPWNGPESAYVGYVPSNDMECDNTYHVTITASRASPFLTANDMKDIFIDCVPRIVVLPKEKRFALGQMDMEAFNINVFNPRDQSDYTLDIIPAPNSGFTKQWITCKNCYVPIEIDAGDSISVPVRLDIAARAGIYPLTITATDDSETYSDDAVLMIYAESLPEFSLWQLAVLLAAGIVIYALIASRKKDN